MNWDEVRVRTAALHDRAAWDGGTRGPLPPPLSEAEVRDAERQFGIIFPEDYRHYLRTVSAGGRVRTLRRAGTRWVWEGDTHADRAGLRAPFPDQDAALAECERLWSREPREDDFPSAEAHRTAHRAWEEAADAADEARTAGAVILLEHGCGFATLLVVSGPQRGTMWFDGRATSDRVHPLPNDAGRPATFAEWYVDWLEHEEQPRPAEAEEEDRPIWYRWFSPL
ncbi:SMI1/KNR4 family protein [Actinacidiphila sp. bgisy160]|uniref:SMI1/KNR4 family protein n=1 Tax=Actinacidiphila sp. bgisy160 TaxID=3413796 RepID=UPI003D738BDC